MMQALRGNGTCCTQEILSTLRQISAALPLPRHRRHASSSSFMLAAQHAPLKRSGLLDEMRLLANVSPSASASGAMPIVIWFPGCVEHACTAVKPATSPPRQINGPTKQGMQHTQRTRPDMGGCRDKSKRQRECSLNRISTAPAVDALPR